MDVRDVGRTEALFAQHRPYAVFHLAAKAGVRPSIEDPLAYADHNITATLNLLRQAAKHGTKHFIFASSSSVYGNNRKVPFRETDSVDHPISPYAATKKAAELLCHTYHHLYGLNVACLRFFTVYGPRQRPDLAIHKFCRAVLKGEPITLFGDGSTSRDYTYIDDIVDGILASFAWSLSNTHPGYEIFNLGNSRPIKLAELVSLIEEASGLTATLQRAPIQSGDVELTFADITKAGSMLGYAPRTDIRQGLDRFVRWMRAAP
jgi:UDP-glucuronate 4-epimerase